MYIYQNISQTKYFCNTLYKERNPQKIQDPAGIQTQDLLTRFESQLDHSFSVDFILSPKYCISSKSAKNSLL